MLKSQSKLKLHFMSLSRISQLQETPEPFPLPPEVCVQKAEAGWAHCVAVTGAFHDLI